MRAITTNFFRSLRLLELDGFRSSIIALTTIGLLLAAWISWLLLARVSLYQITDNARIEVARETHPIESPISGRVVAIKMALGQQIEAGDLLLELDTSAEQLQLNEERTRLNSLSAQLRPLRDEIKAEEDTRNEERQAAQAALVEARSRQHEAELATALAEDELSRIVKIQQNGLIPEVELARAKAEVEKKRAAVNTLRLALDRLEQEQRVKEHARQARIERLNRDIALLDGDINAKAATIGRVEHESERHLVRASITGQLGEVASLHIGSVLREGDKLGAIVPSGELRLVANLRPEAIGKVRPGQPAQLRLDGYSWAQYGSIPATVTRVAGEVRDGRVRVELSVNSTAAAPISLQHGLPGTVQIEVERLSPAALLLRAAGKILANPVSIASSGEDNQKGN